MDSNKQACPVLGELILEQTADAVIYANRQGMIERWNAAAATMFGYGASEALGQSLDLIIPEHLRFAHWRGFEAAVASGSTRLHGRPTITRKLYVEMSFALVVDAADRVLGSVAIARDLTERMEQQRALKAGALGKRT